MVTGTGIFLGRTEPGTRVSFLRSQTQIQLDPISVPFVCGTRAVVFNFTTPKVLH
jgi:hypothetical protein